jgi:hypothetical protein
MPLKFKVSGGASDFKSVPAGSHIAVCNLVADLGLQPGSGLYPAPKQQVYLRFEVPAERIDYERDGKKLSGPVVIGSTFTASMHEKANLRKQLEGWRGRKFSDQEAENFDVSSILGVACMLNVIETVKNEKVYSNIASISGLPKGVNAPKAESKLLYYAEDAKGDYDDLPEWLRKKISEQLLQRAESPTGVYAQPEVAARYDFTGQPPVEAYSDYDGQGITDDDIPF